MQELNQAFNKSINLDVNMKEQSLVAQRIVYEGVINEGALSKQILTVI